MALGAPVVSLRDRALVLCCVLVAYGSNFWPGRVVLGAGLSALGNPPYAGFRGMFLPHLLLYSTFPAVVCAIFWAVLIRMKLLPPIPLRRGNRTIGYGTLGAAVAIAATIALVGFSMPAGTIHWIGIKPWGIAGNIFSNFYEEFIFRGFVLSGLTIVFGFWPAALLSSAFWDSSTRNIRGASRR